MAIRQRGKRWFFRTTVKFPDGTTRRISGSPGHPGPYHDLPNSKVGAQEAQRRGITHAMTDAPTPRRPEPKAEVPTVTKYSDPFLDDYAAGHKPSAQVAKRQILNAHILPWFGSMRLDEIRQHDVDKFIAHLLRGKRSRKTVNNITAVLSSLLRYAHRNRVIPAVDLTFMLKTQDTEIVAVAPGDVGKLAEAADARWRVAILLAADAGLRVGEIRALLWCDVNELAREITVSRSIDPRNAVSETKGWERRALPVSDRLWSALRDADHSRRHVVPRTEGDEAIGYDATRETIRGVYNRADVKIPPMPWHSLRHTFCTELARAGVPVHVIKELAGHKSIETTLRYMHTDRAAKRDAIGALARQQMAPKRADRT